MACSEGAWKWNCSSSSSMLPMKARLPGGKFTCSSHEGKRCTLRLARVRRVGRGVEEKGQGRWARSRARQPMASAVAPRTWNRGEPVGMTACNRYFSAVGGAVECESGARTQREACQVLESGSGCDLWVAVTMLDLLK